MEKKQTLITDRKPDETGAQIKDKSHDSDDYYEVFVQTTDGKFVDRFTEIYSKIPSFIVNGKEYYKGKSI